MANRFQGVRKAKLWEGLPGIVDVFTGAETALGGRIPFSDAGTVIRMIGGYVIAPETAVVAGDRASVTVAIGIISSDAYTAGSGSVPDPNEEPEYPWLFRKAHTFLFGDVGPDLSSAASSLRYEFDIRTMRKFKPRESLAMIFQYVNANGDPPLTINVESTRVLRTLH